MRLTAEQLAEIKKEYGVNELWSFSKVHTYIVSPYNYYLRYIRHERELDKTSIYSQSGTAVHDLMERLYNKEIKYEDMLDAYEEALIVFSMAELKYNKSDAEKNAAIANKYESCVRHYLQHHQIIPGETKTEAFVTTKIGKYVFQGYADMISFYDDVFTIYDFKTSTKYTGDKIKTESAQLLLYAQALMQKGIPLERIRCCWDFCKYTDVKYLLKNGSEKVRTLERNDIGSSLASAVKTKLKDYGCTPEEIQSYLEDMIKNNTLDVLPKEVQEQFTFSDCIVYVPLSEEFIEEFNNELLDTLNEIESKTTDTMFCNTDDEKDKLWWDSDELLKKNSYYHINLNSYTPAQHKPWGTYLRKLEDPTSNMTSKSSFNNSDKDNLDWMKEFAQIT